MIDKVMSDDCDTDGAYTGDMEDDLGKPEGPKSSQQKDTSQEELVDLDEATNITISRS